MTCITTVALFAQNEKPVIEIDTEPEKMATYQEFGGFIIDLNKAVAQPMFLPKLDLSQLKIAPYEDFTEKMGFDLGKAIYGVTPITTFGTNSGYGWGYHPFNSPTSSPINSATFRINDKWRMTTSGDYNAEGYRRPNPSALPWEKNDFHGAFELKSSSGFSVRFEVQRKENPYGPSW